MNCYEWLWSLDHMRIIHTCEATIVHELTSHESIIFLSNVMQRLLSFAFWLTKNCMGNVIWNLLMHKGVSPVSSVSADYTESNRPMKYRSRRVAGKFMTWRPRFELKERVFCQCRPR